MQKFAALLLASLIVMAPGTDGSARDHDRARSAVQSGDARPLEDILAGISSRHPGRLLDAQLQSRGNRHVYRIKLLDPEGNVVELTVDARSAEVLQVRGPGGRR